MKKIAFIFSMLILMIFLPSVGVQAAKITYYGHRGLTNKYPENTMISFQAAMKAGFDGIEFDMFETDSKDLLVFHDASLQRLCKKRGEIYSVTAKTVNRYPIVTGSNVKKLPISKRLIPTFEKVVRYMASTKGKMYIHLKYPTRYSDGAYGKIASILRKYHMENRSVIFCGNFKTIRRFQEMGFKAGYLEISSNKRIINTNFKECVKNKVDSYVMFKPQYLTDSIVKICKRNKIQVGSYKVRTKQEARRLKKMKVNFMFNYGSLLK